jgi:hypothetical protein
MFKGYKRRIELDFNYDQVKEGIPNVKKQMAVLNAEFRKSSTEAAASGKTIDQLGVKYDMLSNKVKIQEQEVAAYRKQLEKATEANGANSKAVQNATTSLSIAEAKLGKTKAELSNVSKELDKQKTLLGLTSDEWDKLGDKTTKIGRTLTTRVTAPIIAAGAAAFKMASDFTENVNKVGEVFEENAVLVERWAEDSIKNMGVARSTALDMAALFGDMGEGMGLNSRYVLEYSMNLSQLAADLASFKNVNIEVAKTALASVYTGETESLKKLGVVMTEANLQQFAYSQGIQKSIKNMTQAEKVQLRYSYVMDVTSKAQGDFSRTSDEAANQVRIFTESIKELGERFGEEVIPMVMPIITWLNDMIQKFSDLDQGTKKFIVTTAGWIAIIGPTVMILGNLFRAISDISGGIKMAKGALDVASKAGKAFSGLLGNTQFLGFAKWALVIAGVALALGFLIDQLNQLLGKSKETNNAVDQYSKLTETLSGSVRSTAVRGYAVGTKYHPGGMAVVGEEGPELVNLPRGSQVFTNQETQGMLGGDTFILQVKMDEVSEVHKLVRVFEDFKSAKRAGVVNG